MEAYTRANRTVFFRTCFLALFVTAAYTQLFQLLREFSLQDRDDMHEWIKGPRQQAMVLSRRCHLPHQSSNNALGELLPGLRQPPGNEHLLFVDVVDLFVDGKGTAHVRT